MTIPGSRILNLTGFLACAGMTAYALYAEHQLLLDPCPLCVFQRMAVISMGIIFVVAAAQNPAGWGRRVYAALLAIAAASGAGVSIRHVWLQSLPPDQVPSCGPGFEYIIDSFPLSEALSLIFTGSGECAVADWHFLGLTMPAWVLICIVTIGSAGIWANLRKVA